MRPLLFSVEIAGQQVGLHTYGLLIAVGFALGIALAHREGRRAGLDGGKLLDLSFWILVSGLLGSRALYVALNWNEFAAGFVAAAGERPLGTVVSGVLRLLKVWEGGLVFYGGVIAAAATTAWLVRRNRWSFPAVADVFAPSLAVGHALGRLGCFAAGCCFGKACSGALCVSFPPGSVAFEDLRLHGDIAGSRFTPPLHPTQLYEAAGELALFAVLVRLRARKRFHGEVALAYALGYALVRGIIEIFRGDLARRFVAEWRTPGLSRALGLPAAEPTLLSTAQLISLLVAVTAVVLLVAARRRAASPRP